MDCKEHFGFLFVYQSCRAMSHVLPVVLCLTILPSHRMLSSPAQVLYTHSNIMLSALGLRICPLVNHPICLLFRPFICHQAYLSEAYLLAYICLSEASGSWVFPLAIWSFQYGSFPLPLPPVSPGYIPAVQ